MNSDSILSPSEVKLTEQANFVDQEYKVQWMSASNSPWAILFGKATGASHIRVNKPCQDAVEAWYSPRGCAAVVSDGHGGERYFRSELGSQFAVDAFKQCVELALTKSLYKDSQSDHPDDSHFRLRNTATDLDDALCKANSDKDKQQLLQNFCKSVWVEWLERVERHLLEHPISLVEVKQLSEKDRRYYLDQNNTAKGGELTPYRIGYGATLIGTVISDNQTFIIQIGDGCCLVMDKHGEISNPVPHDDRCCCNETTSLCDDKAFEEFRIKCLDTLPAAIMLVSDGIENSFGREGLAIFFKTILQSFIESSSENAKAELEEYLPRLSQNGSGDDVSVTVLYDHVAVKTILSQWKAEKATSVDEHEGDQASNEKTTAVESGDSCSETGLAPENENVGEHEPSQDDREKLVSRDCHAENDAKALPAEDEIVAETLNHNQSES